MASVKWLTSIQVLEEPFQGYWQTSDYGYWDYIDGKPVRRPLSPSVLKSQIARPSMYEVIPAGSDYIVTGAAWCGNIEVSQIELSTDGGQHWAAAEFIDPAQPYVWRRWQFLWKVPQRPGQYTLAARAKDANGGAQSKEHNPNYGTYVINHPLPIDVIVRKWSVGTAKRQGMSWKDKNSSTIDRIYMGCIVRNGRQNDRGGATLSV